MLFAESEEEFERVVDEYFSVCKRRELKVNAGKSKVMVFERTQAKVVDFSTPYRVSVPVVGRCEVVLEGGNERV